MYDSVSFFPFPIPSIFSSMLLSQKVDFLAAKTKELESLTKELESSSVVLSMMTSWMITSFLLESSSVVPSMMTSFLLDS